jgi:hypothetical protein
MIVLLPTNALLLMFSPHMCICSINAMFIQEFNIYVAPSKV